MADRPTADLRTPLGGRYELSDLLGAGGMADVYRARDILLGRDVAVKVFRTSVTEEQFDHRQRSEIAMLASLSHPGLVTIFDAGSGTFTDGSHRAFLVMELVPGPSLAERLADGPLPAAETALIGAQVAESLAYIHAAAVVHRDVKPANILLSGADSFGPTQAWTKLTDFGIARLVDGAHMTSTGVLLGTPGYLSPEQATGSSPGPPTDVYALGLVLLECRTGVRCFPGNALESASARLHRDPDIPADVGAPWVPLLRAMTSRRMEDRPTADDASARLRELTGGRDATRVQVAVAPAAATQVLAKPSTGRPALRRQRPLQIAGGVVVAVAVVGALWAGASAARLDQPVPPTYPAISGPLGEHLEQLQESVSP